MGRPDHTARATRTFVVVLDTRSWLFAACTTTFRKLALLPICEAKNCLLNEKQIYENNFQNQEGAGNKANLLLCTVFVSRGSPTIQFVVKQ